MATTAEIKAAIVPRLARQALKSVVWADIAGAFGASSPSVRSQLVVAVRARNMQGVATVFNTVMSDWATVTAEADADAILADGALSLDELDRVYGPF